MENKLLNIRTNGMTLVPSRREVIMDDGRIIRPTRLQFNLMYYMAERRTEIVSREDILKNVWGDVLVNERTVDVHIAWIRKTFGFKTIETMNSSGYIWNDECEEESWDDVFAHFHGSFASDIEEWLKSNYQSPKKL
jgi:DNA-binding response OmpR family regulator